MDSQSNISADELLKAAEKLSPSELERFVGKVIEMQAHRKAPHLSSEESTLLARINTGLSAELKSRLNDLAARRENETLREEERAELIELTDQLEEIHATRLRYLSELARLRSVSLTRLMDQLGIQCLSL
jgi:hemerythrin-like domain-containing protein